MSDLVKFGLDDSATVDEVKKRWRELAAIHHPDRGGDSAEFSRWNKLYEAAMVEAQTEIECPICDGKGAIVKARGFHSTRIRCSSCGGTGKVPRS